MGICLGQAPYIDPTLFVGRDAEIEEMSATLGPRGPEQQQQRFVLGGMGGIGKTQLAIAYAKRCGAAFTSVFWLNAASEATIKASFRVLADLIYAVQDPAVLEGELSLVHTLRWLSDPKNKDWLLIFDNYDEPDQYSMDRYYPPASHGSIIVTTRRPDRVAGTRLRLQPLSKTEDGLKVLQTRSQRKDVELSMDQPPQIAIG